MTETPKFTDEEIIDALIHCIFESDWNCCGSNKDVEIWNYLTWNPDKQEQTREITDKFKQKIITALDLYRRLGEWKDGIKDGIIHVMPEETYQKLFTFSECAVNLVLSEDERRRLQQEIDSTLARFNQFRVEINNLMMSLAIFDDDRHKHGEPMIYTDAFARYSAIIKKFEEK